MGSEKGLEGRGRGKKRRLEGLEVKMTSSFSLLFFYFFKKLESWKATFFLSSKGIDLPFGRAFQL